MKAGNRALAGLIYSLAVIAGIGLIAFFAALIEFVWTAVTGQ